MSPPTSAGDPTLSARISFATIRTVGHRTVRRGGDLFAVHVVPEDGLADPVALDDTRELVRMLGGTFKEVIGANVPDALLQVARAENVTQVVMGASDRSRWRELTRGSVINRMIRQSGEIDVHVISNELPPGRGAPSIVRRPATGLTGRRQFAGFAVLVLGMPVLTGTLAALRSQLGLPADMLVYLTFVVLIAAIGGLWPAVVAAVVASLVINWFFTPLIYRWTIAELENVLALVTFVIVAVVVSALVDRAARLRADAARGRAEAELLARMSGWLVAGDDPLPALVDELRTSFALDSVAVMRRRSDGSWSEEAHVGAVSMTQPSGGDESIELEEAALL